VLKLLLFFGFLFSNPAQGEINFSRGTLEISGAKLQVEIAKSPRQHARGLMFRKHMAPEGGMLFVFDREEPRSFWMKNTFIDLDIGYFDKNKRLIDIKHMKAVKSELEINLPRYLSLKPAQYALEVNKGWFKKNNISLGAVFSWTEAGFN